MATSHQEFRLANDLDTPADTLSELVSNANELVRGSVALNNSTPAYLLQRLFFDESEHVQECLKRRLNQN